jgi:hypothetical protein
MGDSAVDVLTREHQDLRDLFARVRDHQADRVAAWAEVVKQTATHIAVERTFVYPVLKRRKLTSPGLVEDLRRDYNRMEHLLVLTERRKINSPGMPDLINEVLSAFEAHEERCRTQLSPALQEHLSAEELEELGAKMRAAGNVILSHPHPHLLALGPIYQLTTRLASRWDRLRDRTVRNR